MVLRWGDDFAGIGQTIRNTQPYRIPVNAFTSLKSALNDATRSIDAAAFRRSLNESSDVNDILKEIDDVGFAKLGRSGSEEFIVATRLDDGKYVPDIQAALDALKRGGVEPVILKNKHFAFIDIGDDIINAIRRTPGDFFDTETFTRQFNVPPERRANFGKGARNVDDLQKSVDDIMKDVPWYKTPVQSGKKVLSGVVILGKTGLVVYGVVLLKKYLDKLKYRGTIKKIESGSGTFLLTVDPKMPSLNTEFDKVVIKITDDSEIHEKYKCLTGTYTDNYTQMSNRTQVNLQPSAPSQCLLNGETTRTCTPSCGTVEINPGTPLAFLFRAVQDAGKEAGNMGKNLLDSLFDNLLGGSFAMISGFSVCCILTIAAVFIFVFLKGGD